MMNPPQSYLNAEKQKNRKMLHPIRKEQKNRKKNKKTENRSMTDCYDTFGNYSKSLAFIAR